ncbi:Sec34-like family-domain-containing protein [Flagelloscypha sp. PMI_526]|nr:Sec34-like family-domain-containing protein [Flagelloscypha sp. PMI_526]
MAAARQPQRARTVPSQLGSPRPQINLEEWETNAPLTSLGLQSVTVVKAASERATIPLKFQSADGTPSSRPSTPVGKTRLGSRPSTPLQTPGTKLATTQTHPLHPSHPIQTAQQFYDWFSLVDKSVAHAQGAHFRAHLSSVASKTAACDELISKIDSIETEVTEMLTAWRGVEEGGRSLQGACEVLLEERDKLIETTDAISERLEYFTELEHATRMLNHPGESIVLEADFLYMVERVDICIDYLRSHRSYREAELYLLRFHQCMTRAMTLVKMYFVNSLRVLSTDVLKRMGDKDVSSTAQTHLLYTRFKSFAPPLAPLLAELEHRSSTYPTELGALLAECHSAYFAARNSLIVPRLVTEVRALGIDAGQTGIVELTRAGCGVLRQLCTDEFDLYREFFGTGEEALYAYLERLCDYLYDDLRPRILHETRLSALCEVCTVLQALMVLDREHGDEEEDEESPASPTELNLNLSSPTIPKHKRGLKHLHLSRLLQMVLQDAQTRLFFKAQSVIQSEVRYYTPKESDLEWPEKLSSLTASQPTLLKEEDRQSTGLSQLFDRFKRINGEAWYPTLRKTVSVLDQLHDFIKPAIFTDIAVEALTLCRQSLVTASLSIKLKSSFDGDLFLVRHLLVLKDLAYGLDLELAHAQDSSSSKTDGSGPSGGMTDALASVLTKTTSLLPDAVFSTLKVPRDAESSTTRDAKQGIDSELRAACEAVIKHCADACTQSLQPTTSSSVDVAMTSFTEKLSVVFPNDAQKMRLYLEDAKTAEVLLGHVMDRMVDAFGVFREEALRKGEGKDVWTESKAREIIASKM